MIGRTAELGLIQERLRQARAGVGSLVLAAGEPGIAKTTLAAEVVDNCERRDSDRVLSDGAGVP